MNEFERQLLELRSECCHAPPVFKIYELDDRIIYDPWDYCPTCLKVTSFYNREHRAYEERIKSILLTDRKLSGIIRRKIKDVHSEAISFTDDEDSETCSVCKCDKGQSSCH